MANINPFQPRDIVAVIQQIQRAEPTLAGQVAELSKLVIALNSALRSHTGANEKPEPGCRNFVLDMAGAPVLVEAEMFDGDSPLPTMVYVNGSWVDLPSLDGPRLGDSFARQITDKLRADEDAALCEQAEFLAAWREAA